MLTRNKLMAARAVKYVKDHMPLGAANRGVGNFLSNTFGLWDTDVGKCLTAAREDLADFRERTNNQGKTPDEVFKIIRFNANNALLKGCGNCDEQAMAAFWFLYNRKVRPLDLYICPSVHVFVVLGRSGNSVVNRVETWGKDAVICDPWANWSYEAKLRPTLQKFNLTSINVKEMVRTGSAFRAHD